MLLSVVSLFAVSNSNAQIIIHARLGRPGPVVVRPMRPSPHHVWVSERMDTCRRYLRLPCRLLGSLHHIRAQFGLRATGGIVRDGWFWVGGHWSI